MIKLSRINKSQLAVNPDLIEFLEETPDTVVSLSDGRKIIVRESVDEIIQRIVHFRRKIHQLRKPYTGQ